MLRARDLNTQSADQQLSAQERRRAKRFRTFKKGLIEFPDNAGKMFCTIRDFSSGGARLKLDDGLSVPDNFNLYIEENRVSVDCRVAWRSESEIDVEFLPIAEDRQ